MLMGIPAMGSGMHMPIPGSQYLVSSHVGWASAADAKNSNKSAVTNRQERIPRAYAPACHFVTLSPDFPKMTHEPSANDLISLYGLNAHPEGGFFKETYRATENAYALPQRFK